MAYKHALLVAALHASAAAKPDDVRLARAPDGGVTVTTSAYSVAIGPAGYLQSIRAGGVEFLRKERCLGTASGVLDYVKPGHYGLLHPELSWAKLGRPAMKGVEVVASGDNGTMTYQFRPTEFDLLPACKTRSERYLLLPSQNVVRSLDVQTDRAVRLTKDDPIGITQEGMRWVTRQGPVLIVTERVDGYANAYWWAKRGEFTGHGVSLRVSQSPVRYTCRPTASPKPVEAIELSIKCESPDFLVPGGQPVHFDITAINVANTPQQAQVDFEVRTYATRETVGSVTTQVSLAAQSSQPVNAQVDVREPGPYRGTLLVKEGDKTVREIGWIFVYDFPNYKPRLTRPPDFKAFWEQTLAELRRVPMDPQLKLNKEYSNDEHEVYEVSLATLNDERFWAWYSKPRKPGKYPVVYRCPPTGPFHPRAGHAQRSRGPHVSFYIAVHGFDLYLSDRNPANGEDPRNRYHTAGIESPKTARWRLIFASLARGMDFLLSRPEVDPQRIAVTGSSQGGGLSLVLAGLRPYNVAFCSPTCAGLCRLDWTVLHQAGYWPFRATAKPEGQTMDQFLKTISYFDAANFAPDIRCPVAAHCQLLDWVTTSGGQIAAFGHLKPGQTEIISAPWEGHGGSSVESRSRYRGAMDRFMKGKPPIVKPSK